MDIKSYFLLGFMLLAGGLVLAQQQSPVKNSYVQPHGSVGKKADGSFGYLQTDTDGSMYVTLNSPGPVTAGQPTPPQNSYVQPYAPVAQDTNGNWHYLLVDTNGNVYTTTAGDTSGVNVNGTPMVDPNFNATAPAVDSGFTAGTYKVSGSNVILEVPTAAKVTFSDTKIAQVAAVTDTTMVIVGGTSALYRFTGTVNCTTTSAAAVATLNLKYTDTGSASQTVSVSDACTALVTTGVPNLVVALWAKNGTAITYGVSITNTPTYDVDVRLESM